MSLLSPIYYVSLIAIAFVAVYIIREYKGVKALSEGPPEWGMSELAGRIRKGSQVFIKSIFKVIIPVAIGIAILLSLFVESFSGLAFRLHFNLCHRRYERRDIYQCSRSRYGSR